MKKNKPERIDEEFSRILREVMLDRAKNGLANNNMRELSLREATFLTRTAPSFTNVLKELRTLPKRRRL